MLYVSVDQHRKHLTTTERGDDGEVSLRRQVGTGWDAVREYWAGVRERSGAEGFVVILEVCGFNDWLLELLREYGVRDIVLIQPSKRQRRKTDRRDANQLGELLWVNRHRLLAGRPVRGLRRVHIASAAVRAERRLTSLRWRLGRERTKVLNRVRHLLRRHCAQVLASFAASSAAARHRLEAAEGSGQTTYLALASYSVVNEGQLSPKERTECTCAAST